jgi:hypothetical protein
VYTSSLLHSNTLCRCSGILNVYVISVNVLRRPNRGWETIQTSYVFSSVFVSHSNHSTQLIRRFGQEERYGGVIPVKIKPS